MMEIIHFLLNFMYNGNIENCIFLYKELLSNQYNNYNNYILILYLFIYRFKKNKNIVINNIIDYIRY